MLSFYVLTDLHYYSPKSGTSGKAFEIFDSTHQVLTAQSPEVLQSCFDKICADNRSDVVLISGDITSNGEIFAHEEIIPMLRSLKQKGKKVYLITATHDYRGEGYTTAFDGDTSYHTPAATRDMLFDMYREFGPDDLSLQLSTGYPVLAGSCYGSCIHLRNLLQEDYTEGW